MMHVAFLDLALTFRTKMTLKLKFRVSMSTLNILLNLQPWVFLSETQTPTITLPPARDSFSFIRVHCLKSEGQTVQVPATPQPSVENVGDTPLPAGGQATGTPSGDEKGSAADRVGGVARVAGGGQLGGEGVREKRSVAVAQGGMAQEGPPGVAGSEGSGLGGSGPEGSPAWDRMREEFICPVTQVQRVRALYDLVYLLQYYAPLLCGCEVK